MGLPTISGWVLRFFRRVVRRYFRRGFGAVRMAGRPVVAAGTPVLVYANHSGWWDPMVSVLLGETVFAGRRNYAPMDAQALEQYGILKRVGVFGVEMGTARGAARFLRTGLEALRSGGVLWVTPQGRFADARERPLGFKPGLARLAAGAAGCVAIPLAIEYVFWNERLPEALLCWGEPVRCGSREAEALEGELEGALLATMERLKGLAMAREAGAFETVLRGRVGTGGFYELGQRIRAVLLRKRYVAGHGDGGGEGQ